MSKMHGYNVVKNEILWKMRLAAEENRENKKKEKISDFLA